MTDNSHEMSRCIFFVKLKKKKELKMSFAAVVIGTLLGKCQKNTTQGREDVLIYIYLI